MQYPSPMPKWMEEAFRNRGVTEIHGPQTNSKIKTWLQKLKAWWSDDETPWCGTFVAHCLDAAGLMIPKNWMRAKEYATYGTPCAKDAIPFGAICVKSRVGGGHVFFAVARSRDYSIIYGLGGNQHDMVNITPFRVSDIDAVRWPSSSMVKRALPVADNAAQLAAAQIGGSEA